MTGHTSNGAVYFIRSGEFVKIGFTTDVYKRLRSINNGGQLIYPDGYDKTIPPELILVVPFCRMRDERNMQLLFGNHWIVGEWYRWSPAFAHQMRSMRFVTDAVRRKHLTALRRIHGGQAHQKEERWGMQTQELLAHLADFRQSLTTEQRAAA